MHAERLGLDSQVLEDRVRCPLGHHSIPSIIQARPGPEEGLAYCVKYGP